MDELKNKQITDLHKPTIFYLVGLMGSGKTYLGRSLAKKNDFLFIDLDKAIEEQEQLTINEIFEIKGQQFFRDIETETLQQIRKKKTKDLQKPIIIATGGGTACFNNNMVLMNNSGITIWLNENIEKIEHRVFSNKQKRPLLNTIADKDLLEYLDALLQSRKIFYAQSKYCFSGNEIAEKNLQIIINKYV